MSGEAAAAIITAGGALVGTVITALVAYLRNARGKFDEMTEGFTNLREENRVQHKTNETKLDSLADASERIETRLDDHINWHLEQKNE